MMLNLTFCNVIVHDSNEKSKGIIYLSKIVNGLKMEVQIDTVLAKVNVYLTSQSSDTFYWESSIETALFKTETGNFDMLLLIYYNSLSSLELNVGLSPIYPNQMVKEIFSYRIQ